MSYLYLPLIQQWFLALHHSRSNVGHVSIPVIVPVYFSSRHLCICMMLDSFLSLSLALSLSLSLSLPLPPYLPPLSFSPLPSLPFPLPLSLSHPPPSLHPLSLTLYSSLIRFVLIARNTMMTTMMAMITTIMITSGVVTPAITPVRDAGAAEYHKNAIIAYHDMGGGAGARRLVAPPPIHSLIYTLTYYTISSSQLL